MARSTVRIDPTDTGCCEPVIGASLGAEEAVRLAALFKAVADPARLRLLSMIAAQPGGEACVCDLIEPLELSQSTVSHHLKVLGEAGLVSRDQRGKWGYYALVPGALDHLAAALTATEAEATTPAPAG